MLDVRLIAVGVDVILSTSRPGRVKPYQTANTAKLFNLCSCTGSQTPALKTLF